MSITVKKIALKEHSIQTEGEVINSNYLGLVGNIQVQCNVRVGTLTLTIAELRQLKAGQVLHLTEKTNDPIEIILNDQVIAKGELMSYDDQFAIQITQVSV